MTTRLTVALSSLACALLGLAHTTMAQFDPSKITIESPAVAARFPDPVGVRYSTPSLKADRTDFATHEEVFAFAQALAPRSPHARTMIIGRTQQGRSIPMIALSNNGLVNPGLPTVMIIGQQRGDEPAGADAALAVAERVATTDHALLERVNVIIIPRANPDAAAMFRRASANGIDVDRDHLLMQSPEARAIADVTLRFRPQVVVDLHEFAVGGPWVDKQGAIERYDVMLQAAGTPNQDADLERYAAAQYVEPLRRALVDAGFAASDHHMMSADPSNPIVAMGGVQPDNVSNVNALRPAVGLLVAGRGAGIGRAHFARRVHALATASMRVISIAAEQGPALMTAVDAASRRAAAQACNGTLAIEMRQPASKRKLALIDAKSGDEREVEVDWRSANALEIVRSRSRPCGYLVGQDQADAIDRLQRLGARIDRIREKTKWQVETYAIVNDSEGIRHDARGPLTDESRIRALQVTTAKVRPMPIDAMAYVPLDQPMAGLIVAALEPDSQSSFAANRLLDPARVMRVVKKPTPAMMEAPPAKPKPKR